MFKIVWDRPHNGVILTMSSAGEALGIAPRPVFYEELDLLGLNHMGWVYPHSDAPLLWACDRRYFYCGVLVMEVRGGNLFDAPEVFITPEGKNIILTPIDVYSLCDKNSDTMFLIEHEAMEFINGTFRQYKGITKASQTNPDIDFQALAARLEKKTGEKQVVVKESCDSFDIMPESEANAQGKGAVLTNRIDLVIASFSGGKDSQVVLDLVSRVIPSTEFRVIYADTGYELPSSLELYDRVKDYYSAIYPALGFHKAQNHQPVLYYWDEMDSPSKIHRWCCSVMKTAPLYRLLKEINGTGRQPNVLAFEGVRAEESSTRSQYARIGKGVKHSNVLNARPIFEWNVTEVWLYILSHQLPLNAAYRRGLSRVGCVICPLSSELGDCLDYRLFKDTAQPFVDKLRKNAKKSGIRNIDEYLKLRKWKVRAGGNRHENKSKVQFSSLMTDFKARIYNPRENILEWLKVLGPFRYSKVGNEIKADIKYGKQIYKLLITFLNNDNNNDEIIDVVAYNAAPDIFFVGHLKRVINKVTYCVHCEVCEVECRAGALSVVPIVKVDESKCVHCHMCLDFKDNGCVTANSIKQTEGNKIYTNMENKKFPINRYNTFGLREMWLKFYFANYQTYFENDDHQLNVKKQLPIFKKWIIDAGILQSGKDLPTELGKIMAEKYVESRLPIWEILWINLCNDTDLCSWYIANIDFIRPYSREEIDILLGEAFPQYTSTVRENTMKAFQNTFKESPIGSELQQGIVIKSGNKVSIARHEYTDLSLVAAAYSIFRYAESKGTKSLTVSEFYAENQDEGIYRQFGIERPSFERILRTLQEERNHVLNVQLNLGLDNINLREDISSADIIKMML